MYVYLLSKQDLGLSRAELLALTKDDTHEIVENFLLSKELVDYKRLAYTKKVFKLLFSCHEKDFLKYFQSYDFNKDYKESFRLDLTNSGKYKVGELADIIWDKLKNPQADLKNPKTIFEVIFSDRVFVCSRIWENEQGFEKRRAHLRPHNHPTSLHPRLARCLVNLANSKEILDPFCGSGGILIEAGLVGLKITGYDMDKTMLKKAEDNLKHYKLSEFRLENRDALTIKKRFASVVTDLPYGKNSKVKDIDSLYQDFLKLYFTFTERMVVVFPDFVDSESIINSTSWRVKDSFTHYIHKSLSKKIFVLVKNA